MGLTNRLRLSSWNELSLQVTLLPEWAMVSRISGYCNYRGRNKTNTNDRHSTGVVHFVCRLLVEAKKNPKAVGFPSGIHNISPHDRNNIYGCASERRAIHVHWQSKLPWRSLGILFGNPKSTYQRYLLRYPLRPYVPLWLTGGEWFLLYDWNQSNSCQLHQLWRCWVIWTASGRLAAYAVTLFPTICLLASFGEVHYSASLLDFHWNLFSNGYVVDTPVEPARSISL
jgi:hypothetical protein